MFESWTARLRKAGNEIERKYFRIFAPAQIALAVCLSNGFAPAAILNRVLGVIHELQQTQH